MKDLIAKLQIDANCALGAIWMHIDAQAARIAELEAQIAAASTPVVEQKPVTNNGWLIDGSLVYKLDPTNTMNAFEINVTQAEGSRKHDGPRVELAKRILAWLTAPQPAVGADKVICANLGELLLTQAERKAADTDKLREAIFMAGIPTMAINGMNNFSSWEIECWARGALAMRVAVLELMNDTALQAPVREVPEAWISVNDRLPAIGSQVIAYRPTAESTHDDAVMLTRYSGVERISWQGISHGFECICHPSHWMPLPAAPVQEPKP